MTEGGERAFAARLWRHPGPGGWHFLSLPAEVAADIAEETAGTRAGFGSVRVRVTVGATSWATSVFPDAASGTFVLPVKKAARHAEGLHDGAVVTVRLAVAPAGRP